MEFEVPIRHILRPTLSIDMVQWVLWCQRNTIIVTFDWIVLWGREGDDKRRQKNDQT